MRDSPPRTSLYSKIKGIFLGLLIAIGLACIICLIFFNRHKDNARTSRKHCYRFFTFSHLTLEKLGDFDEEADLIIMNHQSVADILCLEAYHPRNICWIAKEQLGEIPFYGYALKGPKMILINREDKRGLITLLQLVKHKLAQHRPIVIFPEGTRNPNPHTLLPFKPGARLIAEKFRLKIQPIVLINTRNIYTTSPLASTSNVARMVLLKSFYTNEHPSTEIFYNSEESRLQASLAPKIKGLLPIYKPSASYYVKESNTNNALSYKERSSNTTITPSITQETHPSTHSTLKDTSSSKLATEHHLSSWYEELHACMQAIHTQHSSELHAR